MKCFYKKDERGFTLIELLVVLVILGLLAALVGTKAWRRVATGKYGAAKTQVEMFSNTLEEFRVDNGRFPTTQEGLEALMTNPGIDGWNGPYLRKKVPLDPWGKPYHYEYPGKHSDYDVYSYGADDREGGEGENKDVTNW